MGLKIENSSQTHPLNGQIGHPVLLLITHPVGVLGRHGVRTDVLDVRDEQVAVLSPPDGGRVNVAHDEPEEVAASAALINNYY